LANLALPSEARAFQWRPPIGSVESQPASGSLALVFVYADTPEGAKKSYALLAHQNARRRYDCEEARRKDAGLSTEPRQSLNLNIQKSPAPSGMER